jgi:hypothetical protein
MKVMKVMAKTRQEAKVDRVYDTAHTPYQRLPEAGMLTEANQQELAAIYHGLNRAALLKQINENLEHLWNLVERPAQHSLSVLVPDVIPLVNVSNSQI